MTQSGACECGAVTYEITGSALHVYACHCLNCQTRSGSAFAEHAMIDAGAVAWKGVTTDYVRRVDSVDFTEVFCAVCHTRLYNVNSMLPGAVFLRAGTLDHSQRLAPVAHIWTSRKQEWVVLPDGVPSFPQSPSPEQFGAVIQAAEARVEA